MSALPSRSPLGLVASALLLLLGLAYPFAVYFGLQHLSPRLFAAGLGALWGLRLLQPGLHGLQRGTALVDAAVLLRWYPVLLSLFLLAVFGLSLLRGQPLIERLARLREPDLPPRAVRYTRRVTQVWCLFFLGNALTAAGLALWAPLAWWTLYTGVIAYGLMGLLFAGEWLVRQRVRRLP